MTTLSSHPALECGQDTARACPSSNKLRHRQRLAGFSLIELMVVIAISAILITVAAPSLTDMATLQPSSIQTAAAGLHRPSWPAAKPSSAIGA